MRVSYPRTYENVLCQLLLVQACVLELQVTSSLKLSILYK